MNRFDKHFNGSDPETSRPFSSGHPDGAWMVTIVYGYLLLFALIGFLYGIYKSITGGSIETPILIGSIVVWALLAPPIKLIFMRSSKAITWCFGLLTVFIIALISTLFSNPESAMTLAVVVAAQAYICFYLFGLKKDNLLFDDVKKIPNSNA